MICRGPCEWWSVEDDRQKYNFLLVGMGWEDIAVIADLQKRVVPDGNIEINPNVAKAGGFQSQGADGDAVVLYCNPLATLDLESSRFPGR